jgi:hypothetical protein
MIPVGDSSAGVFTQRYGAARVGKVLHWADAGLIVSDDAGHGGVAKSAYRGQ